MTAATPRREQDDAYARTFEARILERGSRGERSAVQLEETWFYPESGGQLADRGTLGDAAVQDVQLDEAGVVWHLVDGLPSTDRVEAHIDWGRRFDHMQQHTGQHVLSAAFEREMGSATLSSTLGAERSVIEVACSEVDWQSIDRVERAANQVLWDDREIVRHWTDATGVARFPLRKPPSVTGRIRVIEIPDWDWSACGGTHTRRTGEVGVIKVVGWERVRGNLRFSFLCGRRALDDHAWRVESLLESARRRTLKDRELVAHLEKAAEERDALRKRVTELERASLAEGVRREVGDPPRALTRVVESASREDTRLVATLALEAGAPWAVSTTLAPEPSVVVAASPSLRLDLRDLLPGLLECSLGKGGGNPTSVSVAPPDASGARAAHALACAWLAERRRLSP